MDTEGRLAPETAAAAREAYDELGPAAQVATREAAKAMEFDRAEYRERVTGDVVATVRDALFASLLRVHVGSRDEFDDWLADHPDYEADVAGSENVDRVVWHPVPFGNDGAGVAVAATYQDERDAAVGTLRRRAFGRVYRDAFRNDASGETDPDDGEADDVDDRGVGES